MKKALILMTTALALLPLGCGKKSIPVQSVTLSASSLSLTEGETETISATVTPADATETSVAWGSSDNTVATVKSGTVTALKPGTATIWAEAGGKKGTCTVTVKAKVFPVTGVTLSASSKELWEGESFTLTATVAPDNASNKSVSWASGNKEVATVDQNGKVTAVKAGKATITVTTADGGKTAQCEVTVMAKVASVSLDKSSLTLNVGEEETLTATVAPENANDKSVSWSSSDGSVAKVDQNGKVTAVKAGKATITVTTADGGKTAQCEVTVIVKVVSVSLNKSSLKLNVGEKETLTATIAPENASDKSVSWSSSDESVAQVDGSGKVTAVKAGKATITVTTTDGGKTAKCEVEVNAGEGGTEGYGNGGNYGEDQF